MVQFCKVYIFRSFNFCHCTDDLFDLLPTDPDGLRTQSEQGARKGYTGKQVIHPNQVAIVREAFTPSQERVDWATQLIAAFEQHQQSGHVSSRHLFVLDLRIHS